MRRAVGNQQKGGKGVLPGGGVGGGEALLCLRCGQELAGTCRAWPSLSHCGGCVPEGQGRTGWDGESGQLAPAPGPRSLQRWQLDTGCPEQGCCLDSSSLGLASPQFHPQEAAQARLAEASAWAEARAGRAWTGKLLEVLEQEEPDLI